MGILVEQITRDIHEAMVMEGLGANINLMQPEGSTIELDEEEFLWVWTINFFHKVPITVWYYVDITGELKFTMVFQGEDDHELTDAQQIVFEEAYEWLYAEGALDGT